MVLYCRSVVRDLASLVMVMLLGSSPVVLGRRAELLQDREHPSGKDPCTLLCTGCMRCKFSSRSFLAPPTWFAVYDFLLSDCSAFAFNRLPLILVAKCRCSGGARFPISDICRSGCISAV